MRPFLNVFLIVLIAAFLPACNSNEGSGSATETEDSTTMNVEVGGDSNGNTIVEPGKSDPESQRNPDLIAEAKKAALAKANENVDNAHFREIAPETVKEKIVDQATTTTDKVDGQSFERIEGNKIKSTRKTRQFTPEQLAAPLTGTPGVSKDGTGKIVKNTGEAANSTVVAQQQKSMHSEWEAMLKKFVTASGTVNYTGFKSQKSQLDEYLNSLKNNPPESNWSRAKAMAFWINAYNAFTIKLIVDNMPLNSIQDLDNGKVWDRKWIKIGQKTYSLNNIENDILRPKYKDPRIHFAVNCAAKSCPPLWNRAWTESNLNTHLERRTKIFIDNNKFNRVFSDNIIISRIFEWYASDFGNLIDYLNKYTTENIATNARISYAEYDWALNGK